jgi:hypothetical protein
VLHLLGVLLFSGDATHELIARGGIGYLNLPDEFDHARDRLGGYDRPRWVINATRHITVRVNRDWCELGE